MWAAIFFAAIALSGTSFMVWFLIALLRDGAPSTCCWIVPVCCDLKTESDYGLFGTMGYGGMCAPDEDDYYVDPLENRLHAKHGASGLIALDVRRVTGKLGWRSIEPGRGNCQQHHAWFG